jgi:hypothetical protein
VVDCTGGEFEIVREGKGELELYLWIQLMSMIFYSIFNII